MPIHSEGRLFCNRTAPHAQNFFRSLRSPKSKNQTLVAMPRGGKREGAGRPRKAIGTSPERPKEIKAEASASAATKVKSLTGAIRHAQDLTLRLMAELDDVTAHEKTIGDIIVAETIGDRDSRRRNAMLRAIELPSRATTLKVLLGAASAWAELERMAKAKPADPKQGKKAERATAAREASVGKFAPPPPPAAGKLN
jgi:hypothetical protein